MLTATSIRRACCVCLVGMASALSCVFVSSASASPSQLPDNRVWEQVSPLDKHGNDVTPSEAMAAISGNRLLFLSQGAFADADTALGVDGIRYLATRTQSGWHTESLMPPGGSFTYGANGYQGFTQDLSKGVIGWKEDQLSGTVDPRAPIGFNLYMRDTESGSFQLLNGTLNPIGEQHGFVWGSSDFSKLAIETGRRLTPDSPCNSANSGVSCAYEWEEGQLRLASVLPDGEPVEGDVGNYTGSGASGNSDHAISDDGHRLFFASPRDASGGAGTLYSREDGITTVPISESERTLPGGADGNPIKFQTAEAAHGDRVLFSTTNSLLDADTDDTNDLYLYDFNKPTGERLTLVSEDNDPAAPLGAHVNGGYSSEGGGILGTSEDLRRVYFVADNQLLAGKPEASGPKLYLWDDTGVSPRVTYIGMLDGSGKADGIFAWSAPSVGLKGFMRSARISRDGRYLAFATPIQLTSFDNEGSTEIYRYDAVANALDCITCASEAFPAEGPVAFNENPGGATPINHVLQNVSDSGQVFFETRRGLVPHDSNGKTDLYEYEEGELHLISKGTGADDSHFLDATPSGSDVFFTTSDRLVGWDTDDTNDVYDARVGGGLPEPPPPTPPCEGDACQPPPQPPAETSLASESFHGHGNVAGVDKPKRPCAKGKVRTHGKCHKGRAPSRAAARKGQR